MCRPSKRMVIIILLLFIATLSLAGCSSQNSVVGTWQDPSGGTMQFLKDGTFTSGGLIATSGKYSLPDSNHLKFEYEGLLSIAGSQVYEFKIDGNKLVLTDNNGTRVELTRVK